MHAIPVLYRYHVTMMLFDVYDVQSVASFRIRQSYVSWIRLPVQEYEYLVPVTATHRTQNHPQKNGVEIIAHVNCKKKPQIIYSYALCINCMALNKYSDVSTVIQSGSKPVRRTVGCTEYTEHQWQQ